MDSAPSSPSSHSSVSSSPSPPWWPSHEAAAAESRGTPRLLAVRLLPWINYLSLYAARWAQLPTYGNQLGVVIELRVDVTDSILFDRDENDEVGPLRYLREVVDLVVLTLALEPSALVKLLWTRSSEHDGLAIDDDAIESVLAHNVRTEVKLRLQFRSMETRRLKEKLGIRFVGAIGEMPSTKAAYLDLRHKLVEWLKVEKPAAVEHVRKLSVSVTLEIVSVSMHKTRTVRVLDASDFFENLAAFTATVVTNEANASSTDWLVDSKHTPLKMEKIELTLNSFLITHRVVQAAKTLAEAALPIELKQLDLDPRVICCTHQEVHEFVAALAKGATNLLITTGAVVAEPLPSKIDEHGQDRRDDVRAVLEAIAIVENIQELNLTGILSSCGARVNRDEVWRCLFRRILSRNVPIRLVLDDETFISYEDGMAISEEAARWHQENLGDKLFVRDLCLRLMAGSFDNLDFLLAAFDDVENVDVQADEEDLPSHILHRLLSYPSLKKLTAAGLIIPSMDLFIAQPAGASVAMTPSLEELILEDAIVEDRSSMVRFLEKLQWGPLGPSGLAKTLRRFHIIQSCSDTEETYVSDEAALDALTNVLKTNRTLYDVAMVADDDDRFVAACSKRIRDYNGTHIPATRETRHSVVAKARNLAFLSVIRGTESARGLLDAAVVSTILDFAAPHLVRRVDIPAFCELEDY